jgi:hypothetical protein
MSKSYGHLALLQLDIATNKARQTVKQLANKGDVKSARILAREVVRSNKLKDRLSVSKARLGSIGTQLAQQMGALHDDSSHFIQPSLTPSFENATSNDQSYRVVAKVY